MSSVPTSEKLSSDPGSPSTNSTDPGQPSGAASCAKLLALGVLLVLTGINLRTMFSGFGAVAEEITAGTGSTALPMTLMSALPVTLLGVMAPAASWLARRYRTETVIMSAMVLLTMGLLLRGTGTLGLLAAGTAAGGAAIAVVNVLLPGIVKHRFPQHLGLMSGLYTAAICASAAVAAGLTSPVLKFSGSWAVALACWAAPAALVAVLWLPAVLRRGPSPRAKARESGRVWSSRIAWQLSAFMALQAMMSFSVFAWMAPILRARGLDGVSAGIIVSVSIALQMGGSLAAPAIAARLKDQRIINVAVSAMAATGFALTIVGPMEGVWLWTGLLGLGQGSLTAVALTMIVLRTRNQHVASELSGMMQCLGYGLGSSGTLLVGQLHVWTGSFTAAATMFCAVGALAMVFGYQAGRDRYVGERTTGQPG